jgi:subtilisin family serine protease
MNRPIARPLAAAALVLIAAVATPLHAQAPARLVNASSLANGITGNETVSRGLRAASGPVEVVVKLSDPPLAVANGKNGKRGGLLSPGQQKKHSQDLTKKQAQLMAQIGALGGKELGRVRIAYNGVIVRIDASKLLAVSELPGVVSIRPVVNHTLDLSETVPYIGAAAAHLSGFDGTGVTVAVLDSGIDYTHRNFGGAGTAAAYTAAYGTTITDARNKALDGLFPTAKVVGGFDFVGEAWPTGPLAPDPDPIDCGPEAIAAPCDGGHGTHVADIIAGKSADGTHKGVAPGAKLLAVKVCSAVSTSCSGVAILQGFDFALDPNGDGSLDDAADVINLSLGSPYGQKEDDTVEAAMNASHAGVLVVASAGNSADRPYITGTPAAAPTALSVAQTTVPSDSVYLVTATGLSPPALAVWQTWSATPTDVAGPLRYDTTSAATRIGCTGAAGASPWVGTPLAGTIALIDRGTCSVSLKVANAAAAGAIAAIVANNVAQGPGELPPSFSFGGGAQPIAGYTVTLADGNRLKAVNGAAAAIDVDNPASILGSMVSSSSRGPSYSFQTIKPDIGAPGASVSAEAGTGTGQTAFGGTSGAAPMVSGSAALMLQAHPGRSPAELKSGLMNTANTNIWINSIGMDPTLLAPITRIGGGEVRADDAISALTAAYDADAETGSLSFGYHSLDKKVTLTRQVRVQNWANHTRTYHVTSSFRYASDAASGAVKVVTPSQINVPGKGSRTFNVKIEIDPALLPIWTLNGGARGGDGFRLQGVEFDGYVQIADAYDNVHLAWHVLPHRSAEVSVKEKINVKNGAGELKLDNKSKVLDGRVDVFSLIGTSDRIKKKNLPDIGDNFAIIDLASVGVRLVDLGGPLGIQFGINTHGQRSHPNYPAEFDVYLDTNNDGTDDYVIFNLENSGFAVTGQNVVAFANLTTGASGIRFFIDADLNSANAILTMTLADLGITNLEQPIRISVYAYDNYFTGFLTDSIENMVYVPGLPKYLPSDFAPVVPANSTIPLGVFEVPGGEVSTSQTGLLLLYRDAKAKAEADAVKVK